MTRNPLIDPMTKQTAELERRSDTDAYDGNTYAAAVTIAVRWRTEERVLRYDDGREVVSTAHISTVEVISVGDRITDETGRKREILRVRLNRDTTGRYSHRIGYLA